MRNQYFTQGTGLEQGLYEDLVIEQIKIYGQDVKYVPRSIVSADNLFREDSMSQFTGAYEVEMYVSDIEGFRGDGDLYSKFGIRVTDQVTFIVSRKRFEQAVDDNTELIVEGRPNEGDLIYFPLTQKLFEIKFVEYKKPFYQLQNPLGAFVYELKCELFEYSHEDFETGDQNIDDVEIKFGIISTYTLLSGGTGTFEVGEIISNGSDPEVTGEVASWNQVTRELKLSRRSGDFKPNDTITGLTSNAIWTISNEYSSIDFDSDEMSMSMNKYFEVEGNMIIDFSESNPFGEFGSFNTLGDEFSSLNSINVDGDIPEGDTILSYDATTRKFKFVDADEVLIAAANTEGEINPDGLPQAFVESQQETIENAVEESIETATVDGGDF
jgi:hypothetical protein